MTGGCRGYSGTCSLAAESDHWRRQAREELVIRTAAGPDGHDDPWEAQLGALRARDVLRGLAPQHQAALTLRYMDDLPSVPLTSRKRG